MSSIERRRGSRRSNHRLASVRSIGLACALALSVVAACSGGDTTTSTPHSKVLAGASCQNSDATQLTFWAWVPGINRAVNEFNRTHKSICVSLENPGAGNDEYVLLNNAMKAGSGAPDIAEVEFDELPSFEVQNYLVDLSQYNANKYKSRFVPWAWEQVSRGSAVYAMPSDFGPVAFYYNAPLLAKYHITPPSTWSEFADAAAKLHKANQSAYLVNFSPNDLQWLMSLMAQAGAWPFDYHGGSSVTINWTGPAQMRFARFWQKMIDANVISTVNDAGPQVNTRLDKGVTAAAIYSAWAPSYFAPSAKKSIGSWRASPMPQWTPGAHVATDWGGSTYPVFKQSDHPAEAAQFSEWLTASDAAWKILKTPPSSLFPTYVPLLNSKSFKMLTYPVSGSSHPNKVFTAAAKRLPHMPWPPFMTAALTQAGTTFGRVLGGKVTLPQAFVTFQHQMVTYAKSQGFKVSTG